MDPDKVLDRLFEAIESFDGGREEAIEALYSLANWLEKDGFFPNINNTSIIKEKNEQIANLRLQLAKTSNMATH